MDDFHPAPFIERCLQGDAEAFEPLVRRYQNAAFATALRYLRSRSDAQEIVQDALVAAYCRLGQLRDKERFGGWLMHIVANRSKDWLRERNRTQPLDGTEALLADTATKEHADRMRRFELQEAIDQLPEHYRSALLMYYLSGLSYREIGELMDVPVTTVRGRLQQGRIRLRALMEEDKKEIDMQRIDVADQVQEVVCQIATRQVKETIPLDGHEHIVFNCAIDVDLEIRQAEGEDAVLEGTLNSIGLTPDDARGSVERIEIGADQVDDFLASGPHRGEVFMGTKEKDGHIEAESADTVALWKSYVEKGRHPWGLHNGIQTSDLFPAMKEYAGDMPEEVRATLGPATRISVYREKVEDMILPRAAFTPEIQRVFHPNNTNPERVHGSIGSASLVLSVPKGKRVTVVNGRDVRVTGLRASVGFIGSTCEEIADVEGDVELYDSALKTARNIRGRLRQRHYHYTSVDWGYDGPRARRNYRGGCRLEDVDGEIDIDVGSAEIEATRLTGRVRIYNRYGETRLHQDRVAEDDRIELASCSGDIRFFFKGELIGQAHLSAFTLCGRIEYEAFKDRGLNRSNNSEAMLLSTLHGDADLLAANFVLKSEAGAVVIEKTL